jgi:hypothetical protein
MSATLPRNVLPYPQHEPDGDGHPHRRAGEGVADKHGVSLVVPAQNEARNIEPIPRCVDEVIAEVPSLGLPRRGSRSHLHAVHRVLRTLIPEHPGARASATASVPAPAPAEER